METDFKRWRFLFCFASGRNEKLQTSRTVAQKSDVYSNLWRALALTKHFHYLMSSPEDIGLIQS